MGCRLKQNLEKQPLQILNTIGEQQSTFPLLSSPPLPQSLLLPNIVGRNTYKERCEGNFKFVSPLLTSDLTLRKPSTPISTNGDEEEHK